MSVARYHQRSPRYVLRPQDQSLMRYAPMHTRGFAMSTKMLDVSETGLAFVTTSSEAPQEGDMIKVEFTVPGRKQVACFATVVRVDFLPAAEVKVALQFRNLPTALRQALRWGLEPRLPQSSPDFNIIESSPTVHSPWTSHARLTASGFALLFCFVLMAMPAPKLLTWVGLFWHL